MHPDDYFKIAFLSEPNTGLHTLVHTLKESLDSGLHGIGNDRLPDQSKLNLDVGTVPGSTTLPELADYYSDAKNFERPTRATATHSGTLPPSYVFRLSPNNTQKAQSNLPSLQRSSDSAGTDAWERPISIENIRTNLRSESENARLVERLLTQFDAVHIFVSCEETAAISQVVGFGELLANLARNARALYEDGTIPRLCNLAVGVTQMDRAYYGIPRLADSIGAYAVMRDDAGNFLDRLAENRSAHRRRAARSGDPALENFLLRLYNTQDSLRRMHGYPISDGEVPIIPMSAFGGVQGTAGLNCDVLALTPESSQIDVGTHFVPSLWSVTCQVLDEAKVADIASRQHEPFQVADGCLYLIKKAASPRAKASALIPGCLFRSNIELTDKISKPHQPISPNEPGPSVATLPRQGGSAA